MDTVRQAKEALDICKWPGNTVGQAYRIHDLAYLLLGDKQLDAAEDAARCAQSICPRSKAEIFCSANPIRSSAGYIVARETKRRP